MDKDIQSSLEKGNISLEEVEGISKKIQEHIQDDRLSPEQLEDDYFEGDGVISDDISDSIIGASQTAAKEKQKKIKEIKTRASKNRKEINTIKKEAGIRRSKQSQFPTRSHEFLADDNLSKRGIYVVLSNEGSEIYKDGADIAPRLLMGRDYFGKKCTLNAFNHLITVKEKIEASRGKDINNAPKWIIISNDTSIISDRYLLTRLEELQPNTHAAGAYGFERIRASGKWYQVDSITEQKYLRGCYMQANINNTNWDFIVGSKFKDRPKSRIIIVHGPFIAVRGETFMTIDFTDMAKHMKKGFFHYMADISMECLKRGLKAAQVKTLTCQYENIHDMKDDPDFRHDQSYFASKWQPLLPASLYPNDTFK
jgi:hypothetical protein